MAKIVSANKKGIVTGKTKYTKVPTTKPLVKGPNPPDNY